MTYGARNIPLPFERQIRTLSPELAAVRAMLDPGTLLLSYKVMEEQTVLFMLRTNTGLKAVTLPQGSGYFRKKIKHWNRLATDSSMGDIGRRFFDEAGSELALLLIGPARGEIESAERLLIIPDGPLWYLPFAALPTAKKGQPRRLLIEEKPMTTAVSASLYAQSKARPKRAIRRIVAMGDAVYPAEKSGAWDLSPGPAAKAIHDEGAGLSPASDKDGISAAEVRSFLDRTAAQRLGRIPHTAREVQSIAGFFGSAVRTYLREAADEANFKAIGRDVDIIHVAAHGLLNNDHPLDSALLLTLNENFREGEENGVVFAWEIFEDMRLDADLVVLSACETGLGKTAGGEGLIGLSRAFQFAGARSLIASSWKVEDRATAVFMKTFYGHLSSGKNKAEALRQTQIAFIRGSIEVPRSGWLSFLPDQKFDASHPYYWAPFQLIGPWD